jgi:hypothetical protein
LFNADYYHIKEAIKPYGTVDILRSFAQDEEYPFPNDEFQAWIAEHDRPSVVPLDDRSISSLFRDGRVGVLLFLENKYAVARSAFVAAAAEWKSRSDGIRLIFVNVPVTAILFRRSTRITLDFSSIWTSTP